ncbi:LapA family protein [Clostridium sp. 'deep sea']|uniref:lipopolysaccharide assembly protein LapA domain-containing protein n=1 Tax=Clostridium sp. 'deep sea' TaxID=2779445 RepID=UPI0018965B32|nr:LapA family protein [Clostridium sp. 'deep sea']QOR34125.1 LapA family protein [Clostridium sp. 'deep sea']
MQFFLIIALLIALLAVFFAVQNTTMVTVYFFVWQFSSSLALVLLLSLAIGVILSLLLSLPRIQSKNWQIIKLKKRINEQEKEKDTIKEQIAEQLGTINSLQRQVNEYKEKLLVPPKIIVNNESIKATTEDEQTDFSK